MTARGEIAVEDLAIGDQATTVRGVAGASRPVIWIGHRHVDCRRHPSPERVWPVRVRAGAFADRVPHRDLWLSPDHAVFTDGVLIPIRQLINGTTIAQMPREAVTYYHIELDRHDVLLAEGLAAESYLDTGNRATFSNGGGAINLHPTFDPPKQWSEDAAAPLAGDEARVKPVWQRLAARSIAPGMAIPEVAFTGDPAVHLLIDGHAIRPVIMEQHRCVFSLPSGTDLLRLMSRSGIPTEQRPWVDDARRLGIYVNRIVWHDRHGPHDIPVDHPVLDDGWWAVERDGVLLRRWTNGDASLPLPPGAITLEIQFGSEMTYGVDPAGPTHPPARSLVA
jgi:hypothetical protein